MSFAEFKIALEEETEELKEQRVFEEKEAVRFTNLINSITSDLTTCDS